MMPPFLRHTSLALLLTFGFGVPLALAQANTQSWSGTAFAFTDNCYLATNAHVVENATSINVTKDGTRHTAKTVMMDVENDLAILKMDGVCEALFLDGDRQVRKGADVSTLGFPNIGIQGNESKYTSGQVNSESGVRNDVRLFQVSVPIQPGNSGGPLLASTGAVVGIVSAKLRTSQAMIASGEIPQSVSYAIKVKYLLEKINELPDVRAHMPKVQAVIAKNNEDVAAMAENAVFLVIVTKPATNPVPTELKPPANVYSVGPPTQVPPIGARIVKIGHVAPLSGALAFLGQDVENGARLAIEDVNAFNVSIAGEHIWFQLVAKDDGGDPAKGVNVARELVAEGVSGVVGHMNSGTTVPASRIYANAGIVQISPSAANPIYTKQGFPTAFRVMTNDQALAQLLGRYVAQTTTPKGVVIVDDATAYGQGVADAFADQMNNPGVAVSERIRVSNRQTDFSEIAEKIRAQSPDLVFFGGLDNTAGSLLGALHAQGLDPVFVGADGICTDRMARLVDNVDKVICAEAGGVGAEFTDSLARFKDKYRHRYSSEVQIFAPESYDAVRVMVEAMRQANSTDPRVYINTLRQIQYQGVVGRYQFDRYGDVQSPTITVYQYVGKKRKSKLVYR